MRPPVASPTRIRPDPPAVRRRTRLFLAVGLAFGLAFVALTPPFAAADEATHFFRAYQLSEGRLRATRAGDQLGGRFPASVVRDVDQLDEILDKTSFDRLGPYWGRSLSGPPTFTDFRNTAVYPPAAYAPQSTAILVGRAFGASTLVLLYMARLANLVVFLGLALLAARRFPYARWVPLAVALIPMALFQAGSASGDAVTTGLCLVVLASAFGARPSGRRGIIEAVVLCALLGLIKPPYVLVSLAYLTPRRDLPRDERVGAAGAVLVGLAIAALWSRVATQLFIPYRPYLDQQLDIRPGAQLRDMLSAPWTFAATLARTTWESLGRWLRQTVSPIGRYPPANMPVVAVVTSFALTLVAAATPTDPVEADRPSPAARAWAVAVVLVTLLAISVAVYAYADAVGATRVNGIFGRYLLPLLPALLLALPRPRALRDRVDPVAFDRFMTGAAVVVLAIALLSATHRYYAWP